MMMNLISHIFSIQLPTHRQVANFQEKITFFWIIDINGEETINTKGALDKLQLYQN